VPDAMQHIVQQEMFEYNAMRIGFLSAVFAEFSVRLVIAIQAKALHMLKLVFEEFLGFGEISRLQPNQVSALRQSGDIQILQTAIIRF